MLSEGGTDEEPAGCAVHTYCLMYSVTTPSVRFNASVLSGSTSVVVNVALLSLRGETMSH